MSKPELDERVRAVRQFSRFYTRKIGVLRDGLLGSPLSLTEGRVLYELAQREPVTASDIAGELALDSGYLSRILGSFDQRGLIEKRMSDRDGRQIILTLTDRGREMFAAINARSHDDIAAMLDQLSGPEQARLVAALETVERLLGDRRKPGEHYMLRPLQPGDMGWIIHRHGVLYAEEYGLDESFEAMVARIAAAFIENFDARRERCWIAERHGEVVGFARRAGYRKITLWTNDVLVSARRIYQAAGFCLVREEPHHSFGQDLVGQYWELALPGRRPQDTARRDAAGDSALSGKPPGS